MKISDPNLPMFAKKHFLQTLLVHKMSVNRKPSSVGGVMYGQDTF